ncbi:MAG: hypothetical protein K9H64_15250 [Bacteroidales bacterium]|nr:hypothetical protein [Bacteroidales bacterium]MCF8457351.1 hypothetical protein [Bacteroidales bacterium]
MQNVRHLLIVSLFFILACSKEGDESNYIKFQSWPARFTICPDTVSSSLNNFEIKFDFATSNTCQSYDGYKIVSNQNDMIKVKLYGKEYSAPDIACGDYGGYSFRSININTRNRNKFAIQFLDDKDNVAVSRNIVVSNIQNHDFILKLINDTNQFALMFNHKLVLHDQEKIDESTFRDTTKLILADTMEIIKRNISEEYSKLYYTYLICDTAGGFCLPHLGISHSLFIERGVPEVMVAHHDLYLW